jgi:peptidoglycan-associated lipoprotein
MTRTDGHEGVLVLDTGGQCGLSVVRYLGKLGLSVTAAESTPRSLGMLSRYSDGSYVYPDPYHEAEAILDRKADWLRSNPGATVQIEGHCDERGTTAYNLALGEHRANAVKRYLTALGIDAARLTTISYGEEVPLDPRRDEEAWARNRRAHFVITSQ